MVGLGGTVRTLASIHLRAPPAASASTATGCGSTSPTSPPSASGWKALSRRKRRKIRGLKAERADIILAGAIVIEEVMVFGGYLTLVVCTRGVRDGILLRETFTGEAMRWTPTRSSIASCRGSSSTGACSRRRRIRACRCSSG